MTRAIRFAAFGGFLLAAAGIGPAQEAPAPELGVELRDATVRIEGADGFIHNTLYLDADGTMRLIDEIDAQQVSGRWFVRDQRLCLEGLRRGRECWPYQSALVRGQPVEMTSDRGMTVTVTLI